MQHKQEYLPFSEKRNVSNKCDQYLVYLKQCFLPLYYKRTTGGLKVLVKFRETYLLLKLFHPILSAKFDIYIYLAVKGFRSEKARDRLSVFRSSISSRVSLKKHFHLVCINLM